MDFGGDQPHHRAAGADTDAHPLRLLADLSLDVNGDPLAGTLAVGHDTMHHLIKDLCRGLWSAGFRKLIFIQSHGQEWNFETIAHEVATELRREGKALFIAAATYWDCGRNPPHGSARRFGTRASGKRARCCARNPNWFVETRSRARCAFH